MTILQSAIAQSAAGGGSYQISRSLRSNSADSPYLTRTPASAGNRKTWTWSGWVKKSRNGEFFTMLQANYSSTPWNVIGFDDSDKFSFDTTAGVSNAWATTSVFRDLSAWYHFVFVLDTTSATSTMNGSSTDRIRAYVNGVQLVLSGGTVPTQNSDLAINNNIAQYIGGYLIGRYNNGYMTEINFIDGQALTPSSFGQTDTNTGVWNPIAYTGTYGTNGFYLPYSDNAGADSFGIGIDFSASALNRVELGNTTVGYTVLGTMTYGVGAAAVNLRDNNPNTAAADPNGINVNTAMGYDFGRAIKIRKITTLTALTSGVSYNLVFNIQYSDDNSTWTTITGTPTTHNISAGTGQSNSTSFDDNGSHRYWRLFYLSGTIGGDCWIATLDMFINNIGPNSWFPVNFSVTAGAGNDSLVDTPTNYGTDTGVGGEVRGNYATLNPLDTSTALSNGSLDFVTGNGNYGVRSTFELPASGKWYLECTLSTSTSGSVGEAFGFANSSASLTSGPSASNKWIIYADSTGSIYANGSTLTSGLGTFASGTVLQVAYDGATGNGWVGKNNTWYNSSGGTTGDPSTGANPTFTSLSNVFAYLHGINATQNFNAGQRAFAYTAPSGFKALCTQNLPTPAIGATSSTLAGKNFNPVLYTGNGSTLSVTGVGFQPDWVWAKVRSTTGIHGLFDVVRGVTKVLSSDSANVENTLSGVTAFNSDGFSLGSDWNLNAGTYVAWNWKAGGTAVTNTTGTISSQVSANPTAGISVVTYTGNGTSGATFGHGLGAVPKMVIFKCRDTAYQWLTYHVVLGNTAFVILDSDSAQTTGRGDFLNSTTPSSSLVTLGNTQGVNESTKTYLAYCFSEVAGFSKFGSYVGNGSSDGPFTYCGFRPKFIMVKSTGSASWIMYDTTRSTYNVDAIALIADLDLAELNSTDWYMDILSNGFKLRTSYGQVNNSGSQFIFMAFAESPFNYSRAR